MIHVSATLAMTSRSAAAAKGGVLKLLHRHRWKIIDRETVPSRLVGTVKARGFTTEELAELARDTVVVTYRCADCQAETVKRV